MNLVDTILPWADQPVRSTENLSGWMAEKLPAEFAAYLPRSIVVLIDHEISAAELELFVEQVVESLAREFERRKARQARFVELGFFDKSELEQILTCNTHIQPWILYHSQAGGLGCLVPNASPVRDARGLTPCSSMINHGVAWKQDSSGNYDVWLVTARREGLPWDWESDIGHESAHAAFAPVPLFAQMFESSASLHELNELGDLSNTSPNQVAELRYPFSELAVVAIRGESRNTETGLPVERREDLYQLLRVAERLLPGMGFDRALDAFSRVGGFVDVNVGMEIFEIGAPALRVVPAVAKIAHQPRPPSIAWLQRLAKTTVIRPQGRRELSL